MIIAMHRFFFSKFVFTIKGESELLLPAYKGSTIRGGFGHAFRRIVCVFKNRECSDCLLREKCIYSWVFETPVPAETQMMRKYTAAPHPFVIDVLMNDHHADAAIRFGLILIGRATDYLPYFIYAFEELGRIGIGREKRNFQLIDVIEELPHTQEQYGRRVVYKGTNKMLEKIHQPVGWNDIIRIPPSDSIHLSFLTPTRLKYQNHFTKELEFHIFFRNLLRRISLLSYFHCGYKLDDREFKTLITQAHDIEIAKRSLYWEDWERYSNRQAARMKMGGFMGEITYEGQFEPFWPYIALGEYIHIGKGSSFGLGKYTINGIESEEGS
ncbi:MAG: CRISPR system precrRNA processing endoribonuclease RAMP protein Cas6 [bacterium]